MSILSSLTFTGLGTKCLSWFHLLSAFKRHTMRRWAEKKNQLKADHTQVIVDASSTGMINCDWTWHCLFKTSSSSNSPKIVFENVADLRQSQLMWEVCLLVEVVRISVLNALIDRLKDDLVRDWSRALVKGEAMELLGNNRCSNVDRWDHLRFKPFKVRFHQS